jgi:hypothetical protein
MRNIVLGLLACVCLVVPACDESCQECPAGFQRSASACGCEARTSVPVQVSCSPPLSQVCNPAFTTDVSMEGAGKLAVAFTVGAGHCSDVSIQIALDGAAQPASDFLGAGKSTGIVNLGPVTAGKHTVSVSATGRTGGCNTGQTMSWSGTLEIIRSP